jgi:hypothetical protein
MGLIPERFSTRDKILAIAGVVLIAGGVTAYFLARGPGPINGIDTEYKAPAPVADDSSPAGPTKSRELKIEGDNASVTEVRGGPRANPDYKPPN